MKALVPLFGALLLMVLLCSIPQPSGGTPTCGERPVVNLPLSLRQINWLGPRGTGSCAWASLVTDLNWRGEFDLAQRVRATHGDGVTVQSLCQGLSNDGVPYVWTAGKNNVEFLEQALAGRRGVLVGVNWKNPSEPANHMVELAHLDSQWACVIDCNYPKQDRWMTRDEFLVQFEGTGSIGFVPLYPAVPPLANQYKVLGVTP